MEYNRKLTNAPEAISMKDFGVELMAAIHNADLELQKMREDGTLWKFDLNTIPDNTTVDDKSQGVGAYLTSLMPNKSANIADFSLRNYVERLRNTWSKEDGRGYISDNHMDEAVVADILQTRRTVWRSSSIWAYLHGPTSWAVPARTCCSIWRRSRRTPAHR